MAKTHVLLDIDGCVLDWEKGLKQFISQHCPHIATAQGVDQQEYDLAKRYAISKAQANQLIWNYHTHKSFAELDALPNAQQALQLLADNFCLVAITACGSYPLTQQMRKQNLHSLFPHVFLDIHCTDSFEQKRNYLAQYSPGFWIEDHANNALMGLDYDHQCLLIDQPHNRHLDHPLVTRVTDLQQAADLILSLSHSSYH